MSFCGSVGKLMMDSGLNAILKCTFGGVVKMLTGKKYPHNVRAFRMLTEELLCTYVEQLDTFDDLLGLLADVSNKSSTAKLWADCFICPTLIMMAFTHAE